MRALRAVGALFALAVLPIGLPMLAGSITSGAGGLQGGPTTVNSTSITPSEMYSSGDAGVANNLGVNNRLEVRNDIDAGALKATLIRVTEVRAIDDGSSFCTFNAAAGTKCGYGNTWTLCNGGTCSANFPFVRTDPKNVGSCTLNGGTPSTCTATVRSGAKCTCSPVGATAVIAAAGCASGVVTTTATFTSGATLTNDVNYSCD